MVQIPAVRYASVGGEHVAYQVVGHGPTDGVALTTWAGVVDGVWEHPSHLRIWRTLERAARVVQLDHRGVGASDSVPFERVGDLDDWVADVIAAMDAAEMQTVGMMAEAEQAAVAIAAVARHPKRIRRLGSELLVALRAALVNPRNWRLVSDHGRRVGGPVG